MRVVLFLGIWMVSVLAIAGPQVGMPVPNPAFAAPHKGDWVLGNPQAKVVITEYASLSCGHCAAFHLQAYPELAKRYIDTGKVRFIYREFPLNAPALRAGQLLRCTEEAKKKTMLQTLYQEQKNWAFDKDYETHLQTIALAQGFSKRNFKRCMGDKKLEEALVQSRMEGAKQLGVSGTPSFFINGERFNDMVTVEALSAAIEKQLAIQQ